MKRALPLVVAALLVPAVSAGTFNGGESDAGSGQDAPSTPWEGLVLPGWGAYTGEIRGDDDWYEIREARAGFTCVELDVAGNESWQTTLGLRRADGVRAEVYGHLSESRPALTAGFLTASLEETAFAIGPFPANTLQPGFYAFELQAYGLADLAAGPDAGTGDDAGALQATATEVEPGCFGGAVSGNLVGADRRDVFAFAAAPGEWITVSYGASKSVLEAVLIRPDGTTARTLASGDAVGFEATQGGLWYLAVDAPATMRFSTSLDSVDDLLYGFGLSRDDRPPGQSCRPYCLL